MFAALMLAQASLVRLSIDDELVVQRFLVLSPSVSRMMTLSRVGSGAAATVNGALAVSACHAQTRPIVTLVRPFGVIASTVERSAVQSLVSSRILISDPLPPQAAARNSVLDVLTSGVVSL